MRTMHTLQEKGGTKRKRKIRGEEIFLEGGSGIEDMNERAYNGPRCGKRIEASGRYQENLGKQGQVQ